MRPIVADVAMFYGERSGGIRTYLNEKTRFAAGHAGFEHHVIVPGPASCTAMVATRCARCAWRRPTATGSRSASGR